MAECITSKGWRTVAEVQAMSLEEQRNTAIFNLNREGVETTAALQAKPNLELVHLCGSWPALAHVVTDLGPANSTNSTVATASFTPSQVGIYIMCYQVGSIYYRVQPDMVVIDSATTFAPKAWSVPDRKVP